MSKNEKKNKPLADILADQIIAYILKSHIKIGEKLPTEYELASMFNTSRNTVREAVHRLESRNILVVRQGSGTFLSNRMGVPEDPLGITFIGNDLRLALELSDLRLLIEPTIAELAAKNASEEQIKKMEQLCTEIDNLSKAKKSYMKLDNELHVTIGQSCGNILLRNLMLILAEASEVSIRITENKFNDRAFDEHIQIVQAIRRRDPFGARIAMTAHLNTGRQFIATRKNELQEE